MEVGAIVVVPIVSARRITVVPRVTMDAFSTGLNTISNEVVVEESVVVRGWRSSTQVYAVFCVGGYGVFLYDVA